MFNKKTILFLIIVFIIGIFVGKSLNVNTNLNVLNNNQNNFENKLSLENNNLKIPNINSKETAYVKRVVDGDTIELDDGRKIRYIGINSPEYGEKFYNEAKALNESLVLNKKVNLEFDVQTIDKYGRLLAYVWSNNVLINRELVLKGLAISETIQPNVKYQDLILEAQKQAQSNCEGLWENLCKNIKETSCIKISKIFPNAPGDDNKNKNGEWIEIKNNCQNNIDLNNWMLKDSSSNNKYIFSNFILNSGKSVKIYSGCGKNNESELYWQCPEGKYAIWNNSGDQAFLYDANGNLVDTYKY